MLIQAMVEIVTRTTMDIDTTIKGKTFSQSKVSVFIENKFLLSYVELKKFRKGQTISAIVLLFLSGLSKTPDTVWQIDLVTLL